MNGHAANVGVVPVENINRSIGAGLETESNPLRIIREQSVVTVPADETRTFRLESVSEQCALVDVRHEDPAAIVARKFVRQVNARATMCRAVAMIGDGLDIGIDVGIDVPPTLPVVNPTGYDVPQMRDHARRDEHLAVIVEVETPRIAEAMRHDFEPVLRRMIAPDAAVDVLGILDRRILGERLAMLEDPA